MKKIILLTILLIALTLSTNKEEVMVVDNELDGNEMMSVLLK